MTYGLDSTMLLLILFCIITEAGREVCFKLASATEQGNPYLHPWTLTGIVFWAVELVAWTYVLTRVPLSIAFPLMASSYAVVSIVSAFVLKEQIGIRHSIGVALVSGGVICVGVSGL
ncbi:EamA family transporter [Rhizobium sp. AQ_MP]|uniref:EamA family transporter n=1 Tax=Rhizobium sp. AQ_MP TaxID=2761536 RepID=UPI00163ABE99|nr:EamA family transporter [Rhizobium sp. AQ_MP]MBC2775119.1 EamA family transporter [Rhizobium sp. AQ_MP]